MSKKLAKNKIVQLRVEQKVFNRIQKLANQETEGCVSSFLRNIISLYLGNYVEIKKERQKENGKSRRHSERALAARLFIMETEAKSEVD